MRPRKSFITQPIRSLQTMLRVIAKHRNLPVPLIPDGIYGASTMQAVSAFQKFSGLPPTGTVDQETWEAIVKAYRPAKVDLTPAQSIQVLISPGEVIKSGEHSCNLYLAQAMLTVLSERLTQVKSPSLTGTLDQRTAASIASFQVLAGLPESGELDKLTWKNLALQYPLIASFPGKGDENPSGKGV